jgi:hypothetical protein
LLRSINSRKLSLPGDPARRPLVFKLQLEGDEPLWTLELGSNVPTEKSIGKLERFLTARGYPETHRDIDFLRLLQEARSTIAAHRKGDGYKKTVNKLRLDNRSTGEVFAELLQSGIAMLRGLKAFFLAHGDG